MRVALTPTFLLGVQALSYWPIWNWYLLRMTDQSDEPWGIIALITALLLLFSNRRRSMLSEDQLILPTLLVILYIVTFQFLPPLGSSVFAVLGIASTLCPYMTGRRFNLNIWGLFLLSLPILPTLQFYFGFPLRAFTTYLTAPLISLLGYHVTADGTALEFAGELILVDAPCSGIKMLWGIWYLNYTLGAIFSLTFIQTIVAQIFGALILFVANVIRVSLLFLIESRLLEAPDWAHEGVGIAIFAVVALMLLGFTQELRIRCNA